MKKIRISRELTYLLAVFIMPLGVALMEKANFGVSMVVAPAYIFSLKFSFLTFGRAEYCIQLLLIVIMCLIIKRFKVSYLFSFVTAFAYGAVLDAFIYLLRYLPADIFAIRILLCVSGAVITSFSVAMFFKTYLSPCAYDMFVKVIATHFHLHLGHFKVCYDVASLLISVMLTLSFFGKIDGIGPATIICAFVNGIIIGWFSNLFDKKFEFYNKFSLSKYFDNAE